MPRKGRIQMTGKVLACDVDRRAYDLRELERQLHRKRRAWSAAERVADRSRPEGARR